RHALTLPSMPGRTRPASRPMASERSNGSDRRNRPSRRIEEREDGCEGRDGLVAGERGSRRPSRSVTVTHRQTIYTHPGTGAQTQLLTITQRERNHPVTLTAALDHLG